MFFGITAFLIIFQLIYAAVLTNGSNCADTKNLTAGISDETALKNIQERMELLLTMIEILRQRIDSLDMTLNQQLIIQQNELKKDLEKFKVAIVTAKEPLKQADPEKANDQKIRIDFHASPIDTRDVFTDKNQERGQSTSLYKNKDIGISTKQSVPISCFEALKNGSQSGIYEIKISNLHAPFHVYCLKDTNDSAWIVIQRRQDGSIDFYRRWCEYQNGFGNLEGEFFIGLDKLNALTQSTLYELWIQMEDFDGNKRWAKYRDFAIGGASEGYILQNIGTYAGDAGDSLSAHVGMKWSTLDVDHDKQPTGSCAQLCSGAWWYHSCHQSNLNGQYLRGAYGKDQESKGIDWSEWHGHNYSLKYVHMAIRPV